MLCIPNRRSSPIRLSLASLLLLLWFAIVGNVQSQEPDAANLNTEIAGAMTVGGRGGKVIEMTNQNASGPGSLCAAFDAKGPRIVVFKVSGSIDVDLRILNDHIAVAGQTAPRDGITIKGQLRIAASEVINKCRAR